MSNVNKGFKIGSDVLRQIVALSDQERIEVGKIVKRHIVACARNGSQVESLDRVFIEAIELVRLGDSLPDTDGEGKVVTWEPRRCYEQYISPKVAD